MAKKDDGGEVDQRMVHALAHPLRVLILRMLEKGPSSPKRRADRGGEPLGNVSSHMGVLKSCGCVELVESIPARGAVEHIYKLMPDASIGSRAWREVPKALRSHYAGSSLAGFTERAIEALEAGTAESREGSGVTWLPLRVDEKGWQELRRLQGSVEERYRSIEDKSAERMKSPRDGISVMVAVAAFEIAGGKDNDPS